MRVLLTLLLFSSAIGSAAGPSQTGSFVLTCAAFPANLAEADLVARYGRDNVIHAPVFGADDGPQDGAVVFPGTPDARLEVAWSQTRSGPMWLKAVGSRWTTSSGIKVGADLLSVERANGGPFRLAGFQTEGQGAVRSWSRGRLDESQRADNCLVRIHFQPRHDGSNDDGLVRQVRSGLEYSSGHPALQKLNPSVAVIWLTYTLRPQTAG
jgi:hypothetical protein